MLKIKEINELQSQLKDLLVKLLAGEVPCIEYGSPDDKYLNYLRIYYMPTAGGHQFGLKRLAQGVEGSGQYCPDAEEMMGIAMDAVLHYHRPTRFTELHAKLHNYKTPKLTWYAPSLKTLQEAQNRANALVEYRDANSHFDGAVEVLLEQPK